MFGDDRFREACIELYLELRKRDRDGLTEKEVDFMYQLVQQPWFQAMMWKGEND